MPAMFFLCEQCGEKYKFDVDFSVNSVFSKDNLAPCCPTEMCGKELLPIISNKINGIREEEKSNYDKVMDTYEREEREHQQFFKREKYIDCSGISEDDIKQLRVIYEKEKRFR